MEAGRHRWSVPPFCANVWGVFGVGCLRGVRPVAEIGDGKEPNIA